MGIDEKIKTEQKQMLRAYQKVFLATEFINGQLYIFKDNLTQMSKLALNNSIKHTNKFLRVVEKTVKDEKHEDNLSNDIELIERMFNAFIQAEEKGFPDAFKNSFYKICQEHSIDI